MNLINFPMNDTAAFKKLMTEVKSESLTDQGSGSSAKPGKRQLPLDVLDSLAQMGLAKKPRSSDELEPQARTNPGARLSNHSFFVLQLK